MGLMAYPNDSKEPRRKFDQYASTLVGRAFNSMSKCPFGNVFSHITTVGLKPVALPERANMALHTTTWVTSESNQGSRESNVE